MDTKDPLDKFLMIPRHVRDQLLSDQATQANDLILTKYNIQDDRQGTLMEILRQVIMMEFPVEDLPEEIRTRLQVEEPTARQIAIDIVGLRLLPIQDWLGNVRQYIPSWGGTSEKFVERLERMYSLRFFHRQLFDVIYSKHELGELSVQQFERLDNIIFSLLINKRTVEEADEALQRPEDAGGMNFDEGKASGFLEDIQKLIKENKLDAALVTEWRQKRDDVLGAKQIPGAVEAMTKNLIIPDSVKGQERVMKEGDIVEVMPLGEDSPYMPEYVAHVKSLEEAMERPSEALSVPKTELNFDLDEDEAEVAALAKDSPQLEEAITHEDTESWLSGLGAQLQITLDEEGAQRWIDAGKAFLNDVRDEYETKDLLTKPVEEGGIALSAGVADKALVKLAEGKSARFEGQPLPALVASAPLEVAAEEAQVPTPEPQLEPAPAPAPQPEVAPTPEPQPEPTPDPTPDPTPAPAVIPEPATEDPAPSPAPAPQPVPFPEAETKTPVATPSSLHSYFSFGAPKASFAASNPEETPTAVAPEAAPAAPAPQPEVAPTPEPQPEPTPDPTPEPTPAPAVTPEPTPAEPSPKPEVAAPTPQPEVAPVTPAVSTPTPEPETPQPEKETQKHPKSLGVPGQEDQPAGEKTDAQKQAPAAPRPTMQHAQAAQEREASVDQVKEKEASKPAADHGPMTKRIIRPPEPAPGKTPMVEVKPPETRVMGPLEELESFTILIFRDLAASPEEATSIIKEKIMLFSEQGIGRLIEAKAAWKKSELNQLLIEIGFESAEGGMTVEQVLEQRLSEKKKTLSIEEFNALTDLNIELSK